MKKILLFVVMMLVLLPFVQAIPFTDSSVFDSCTSGYTLDGNANDTCGSNSHLTVTNPTTTGDGCKHGTCYYWDGSGDEMSQSDLISSSAYDAFTFSLWFKLNDTNDPSYLWAIDEHIRSRALVTGGNLEVRFVDGTGTKTASAAFSDTTAWHHLVLRYNQTNLNFSVIMDGEPFAEVAVDGSENTAGTDGSVIGDHWTSGLGDLNGYIDDFAIFENLALSDEDILELYNDAVPPVNFTLTAKDLLLDTSINSFNATVNGTFHTTTTGSINTGITLTGAELINITNVSSDHYVTQSYNNWNISTDLQANLTRVYYASSIHDDPTIETEANSLTLQVNITSDVSDVSAQLIWNGTAYDATKTAGSVDYNFTASFLSPEVDTDTVFNLTWHFNITVNSSITNFDVNSTQQIVEFGIDNCSVNLFQAINFTLFNESNQQIINGSLSGNMFAYIDSVDESRTVNLTWAESTDFGVCIDPESVVLLSEGQFEYSSTGFATETYYLTNYSLNNETNRISLYLTEGTTQVTLSVTDENDDPIEGAFIHVANYDLSTDTFSVTEIHKTDSSGQAIGNIVLLTEWYKFFIYYDGVLQLETSPEKITSTTRNFRINFETDFFDSYDVVLGVSCSLSYTNATNTFLLTFSDDGGLSRTACVDVKTRTGTQDILVNSSCTTSSSGTVVIVPTPTNKTLIASSYITSNGVNYVCGSPVSYSSSRIFEDFGTEGLFFVFLIVLTLVMVGIFNPLVAIVLSLLGVLGGYFLGLIYFSWGALVAFLAIGIVALFRMGRE